MKKKQCKDCGHSKSLNQFYSITRRKTGKTHIEARCKLCRATYDALREQKFVSEHGVTTDQYFRNKSLKNFLYHLVKSVESRARRKNVEVTITREFLLDVYKAQKGLCALTGMYMTATAGKGTVPTNISVDRINSKKGYVDGNVQLVTRWANWLKGNVPESALVKFCKLICEKHGYTVTR